MNKNESETPNALNHVDPVRRGFLAKMLAGGVALPVMSTMALAETPQEGKGKGGKGKGGQGKGGQGKGGQGKGRGQEGAGDPAEMAARLIKEFDKDGDKALNAEELTAALQSMRNRRGQQGNQGAGSGKGKGGASGKGKGGVAGKGKGKGAEGDSIGGAGVVPQKPGQ